MVRCSPGQAKRIQGGGPAHPPPPGSASTVVLLGAALVLLVALAVWLFGSLRTVVPRSAPAESRDPAAAASPETLAEETALTGESAAVAASMRRALEPVTERGVRGRILAVTGGSAGLPVELQRPRHAGLLAGREWAVDGRTMTDDEGAFALRREGASSGLFRLVCVHPELGRRSFGDFWLREDGWTDVGELTIDHGFALLVRVLTASEQPIAGARVEVTPRRPEGPREDEKSVHLCDETGRVESAGIASDLVDVRASAPGFAIALADRVSLRREAREGDALTLHLQPPRPLAGVVRDPRGQPVQGAQVYALRAGPVATSGEQTSTGPAGRFRLDHLEAGYYSLRVEQPGHASFVLPRAHTDVVDLVIDLQPLGRACAQLSPAPPDSLEAEVQVFSAPTPALVHAIGGPRPVALHRGQLCVEGLAAGPHRLEIRVPGAAPLRTPRFEVVSGSETQLGQFTLRLGTTLRGVLVDPADQPLVGVVALVAEHLQPLALRHGVRELADRREVQTDSAGQFTLDHVAPGTRVLSVRAEGHVERAFPIEVKDAELDLGRVPVPAGARLEGRLALADGTPRVGMLLSLRAADRTQRLARTDSRGHYQFPHLPAGTYHLEYSAPQDPDAPDLEAALNPQPDLREVVVLKAGETLTRNLKAPR